MWRLVGMYVAIVCFVPAAVLTNRLIDTQGCGCLRSQAECDNGPFFTTCSVNATTFSMTVQVGADGKTLGGNLWSGSFSETSGNFMAMNEMLNGLWTAKRQ